MLALLKNKVLILLLVILSSSIHADVRFVSKSGASVPPFLSWTTAADSIQKCLDICDNGDTVYVGNGIYHESIVVNKAITLIGMSIDSTIIDGTDLQPNTIYVSSNAFLFNISNLKLIGQGPQNSIVIFCDGLLNISFCKISHAHEGIFAPKGGDFNNLFITDVQIGFSGGCVYDTCHYNIHNSIILLNREHAKAISNLIGGYYIIRNNYLIYNSSYLSYEGILCSDCHRIEATNNIISGFDWGIYVKAIDSAYLYNNIITKSEIGLRLTNRSIVKNSILFNNNVAMISDQFPLVDYNLFGGNNANYGYVTPIPPGDSDRIAYPMFVKDTLPSPAFTFDFHLQKYSPAIDKGDPSILDVDGSRSDAGAFGGPYGETYEYKDLAPMAPKNFTATVTSGQILFKWKKNTEADTGYYSIYMDTTQNFTIDSTKLLTTTSDTLFTYLSPQVNKPLYFKITATDNQGNQSLPSEELYIFINVTGEKYPKEISSYQLYNNYPNPFNPTTTISYKLKERGYVKLLVYDLKGELVKILVNQEQAAGYYETEFNATGLASGIYIYRIEVIGKGNIPVYSDMKKTVLLK